MKECVKHESSEEEMPELVRSENENRVNPSNEIHNDV